MLLIEDNEADVYIAKEVLKESGFNLDVQVARDGESALKFIKSLEAEEKPCPALVLLDLNIPKLSGVEVLAQIRGGGRCKEIPVVVVTSSDSPEDVESVRGLNVSAYFRKPTSLQAYMKLGDVVREVLGEKSAKA
ncbi:MAG: response regulator [Bryobacteraceae bacterium]